MNIIHILSAFSLDLLIGDPYSFPHPVRAMGRLITSLESIVRSWGKRANPSFRTLRERLGGFILTAAAVSIVYVFSKGIVWASDFLPAPLSAAVNIYLIYTCFSVKCLADEARKIYRALKSKDMKKAREYLSYIVGRDTENLNEENIIRAVIETVAENTVDGFISPLFYAILGGAPLAMTYKAINTLDSMVGYRNEWYGNIGFASAKLDDAANFIPARAAGILIPAAAGILGMPAANSFKIMLRDRKNHESPNCAYPEAAAAGALGVQLGGSNSYFGMEIKKPAIGDAVKPLEVEDISRSIGLMYTVSVLAVSGITAIWLCWAH